MSDGALEKVEATLHRLQLVLGITRFGMLATIGGLVLRAFTSATHPVARAGIASGIVLLLGAAAFAIACVVQLKRFAQNIDTAKLTSMRAEIEARSHETRFKRLAIQLLIAAVTIGCTAAFQRLLE